MGTRLAIHLNPHEQGFAPRWIEYCREHQIDHEVVSCYDDDILDQLREFDGLLWHFTNHWPADILIARHIIAAAETMGLVVFPNTSTALHFDDKVSQKYRLEAIGAQLVPTHVFYDNETAREWLRTAKYPLVRKLRTGAGSFNVRLVNDFAAARRFCNRMFGRGISPIPGTFADSRRRIRQMADPRVFRDRIRRLFKHISHMHRLRKGAQPERGYALFQEFMPNNTYDVRIAVVGDRAWGFTRDVRKGDFRASGSGSICYDRQRVDLECVRIAYRVAEQLGTQSLALDFVKAPDGQPLIVEMSYAYLARALHEAPGYWNPDLSWTDIHMWPEHAIISDLVGEIRRRKQSDQK